MSIYQDILTNTAAKQKMIAVLLDPDKCGKEDVFSMCCRINKAIPHFVFVGGSKVNGSIDAFILELKKFLQVPIVLFPGNISQFSAHADALLFLSLISGRNPEFLIGQHVLSAQQIKKSKIETISTGYILIDGGKTSAVEVASHTIPIENTQTDEIISTALAGELLGMKLIYLEAGSGALRPVPNNLITLVKQALNIPLIVGGGICTQHQLTNVLNAGADLVVIGNHFEERPDDMFLFCETVRKFA